MHPATSAAGEHTAYSGVEIAGDRRARTRPPPFPPPLADMYACPDFPGREGAFDIPLPDPTCGQGDRSPEVRRVRRGRRTDPPLPPLRAANGPAPWAKGGIRHPPPGPQLWTGWRNRPEVRQVRRLVRHQSSPPPTTGGERPDRSGSLCCFPPSSPSLRPTVRSERVRRGPRSIAAARVVPLLPSPRRTVRSVGATGGVYKGQGRSRRGLMTRAY